MNFSDYSARMPKKSQHPKHFQLNQIIYDRDGQAYGSVTDIAIDFSGVAGLERATVGVANSRLVHYFTSEDLNTGKVFTRKGLEKNNIPREADTIRYVTLGSRIFDTNTWVGTNRVYVGHVTELRRCAVGMNPNIQLQAITSTGTSFINGESRYQPGDRELRRRFRRANDRFNAVAHPPIPHGIPAVAVGVGLPNGYDGI